MHAPQKTKTAEESLRSLGDAAESPASFDQAFRAPKLILAGVDEAGRGPLAGPVVAAAVILDPGINYPGLGDSKKLTELAREKAYDLIDAKAVSWAWALVDAPEVDRINPLRAAMLAMSQAVAALKFTPDLVLVDGNQLPELAVPGKTVVKGDLKSQVIGAASIMAKVTRDRIMMGLHNEYPQYGFDRHKGYGTALHLAALRRYGPSPVHRVSFRGVLPLEPTQGSLDFEACTAPARPGKHHG